MLEQLGSGFCDTLSHDLFDDLCNRLRRDSVAGLGNLALDKGNIQPQLREIVENSVSDWLAVIGDTSAGAGLGEGLSQTLVDPNTTQSLLRNVIDKSLNNLIENIKSNSGMAGFTGNAHFDFITGLGDLISNRSEAKSMLREVGRNLERFNQHQPQPTRRHRQLYSSCAT